MQGILAGDGGGLPGERRRHAISGRKAPPEEHEGGKAGHAEKEGAERDTILPPFSTPREARSLRRLPGVRYRSRMRGEP